MPSAFEDLCEQRNLLPDEWRKSLAMPVMPEKCLLDMTDDELEEHYSNVEKRATRTREDRALIVLERAQDGRLERQAVKVFGQAAIATGQVPKVCADQVPDMLESLRFELTNTEVHYLLNKFGCTEDFDMIPEAELERNKWLWLVGETQMLKDSYKHINPEAFEVCYESMIHNLKLQREVSGKDEEWPHQQQQHQRRPDGLGVSSSSGALFQGGIGKGYAAPLRPHILGIPPTAAGKPGLGAM